MTISYPVSFPTNKGLATLTAKPKSIVSALPSVFTGETQVQAHQGQWWAYDIKMPVMNRADAEEFIGFLLSLNGREGSFLFGNPATATPRGSVSTVAASQNLQENSSDFTQGNWSKTTGLTVNGDVSGITAPDTSANMDEVVEGSANNQQVVLDTISGDPSQEYTISIFAKKNTRQYLKLRFFDGDDTTHYIGANYDLDLGTMTGGGDGGNGAFTSASIESIGNGIYRCIMTGIPNAGSAFGVNIRTHIQLLDASSASPTGGAYLGDGASSLYIWGVQVELGSSATPYIDNGSGEANSRAAGPVVNGASQTGRVLATTGWAANSTGVLKIGDEIQLGSGSSTHLHKLVADADTDIYGNVTLDIWPALREPPADQASITTSGCKGVFRLTSNEMPWDIDEAILYGLSFSCVEAL